MVVMMMKSVFIIAGRNVLNIMDYTIILVLLFSASRPILEQDPSCSASPSDLPVSDFIRLLLMESPPMSTVCGLTPRLKSLVRFPVGHRYAS